MISSFAEFPSVSEVVSAAMWTLGPLFLKARVPREPELPLGSNHRTGCAAFPVMLSIMANKRTRWFPKAFGSSFVYCVFRKRLVTVCYIPDTVLFAGDKATDRQIFAFVCMELRT